MKTPPLPSPGKGPTSRSSRPLGQSRSFQRSEGPEEQQSFSQGAVRPSPEAFDEARAGRRHPSSGDRQHSSSTPIHQDNAFGSRAGEMHARDDSAQRLADLKKRMDEQLILQQQRRGSADLSPEAVKSRRVPSSGLSSAAAEPSSPGGPSSQSTLFSPLSGGGQTASTESVRTMRGPPTESIPQQPAIRTPSYPFPQMETDSPPKNKHRGFAGAFHKPFTLLSPTIGHQTSGGQVPPRSSENRLNPNSPTGGQHFLPSGTLSPIVDPNFPTPSLYDIPLILNSEPGLDAWWTNLVHVMQDYYGAERMTLAVPGDATDLENVPWGQKATFDSSEVVDNLDTRSHSIAEPGDISKGLESLAISEKIKKQTDKETRIGILKTPTGTEQRPLIQTRHSFAGYVKKSDESLFRGNEEGEQLQRPKGPLRALSHVSFRDEKSHSVPRRKKPSETDESEENVLSNESQSRSSEYFDAPESPLPSQSARVYHVPQSLEMEPDPLIKRTGIVRLLSRDKVVVITREYTESEVEVPRKGKAPGPTQGKEDKVKGAKSGRARSSSTLSTQSTRSGKRIAPGHSRHESRASSHSQQDSHTSDMLKRKYEEYEQAPASPWSQSPAPSPAARGDPEHNPFFKQAAIDENAFTGHDRSHDYTQSQPLQAIGVDQAKTVLHIPLYRRPVPHPRKRFQLYIDRQSMSPSDPVFSAQGHSAEAATGYDTPTTAHPRKPSPIGVLSVLSSIVPYPSTLVLSLEDLIPHITCSFSMAQQYSNLERQTASFAARQFGHGDLGGTFSASSSQLEAVIEQREQLYSPTGDEELAPSTGSSVASPSELAGVLRGSAPGSSTGTPAWDPSHVGFSTEAATTPGHRAGMEGVESYFSARSPNPPSAGNVTSPRRSGPKKKTSDQELQRPPPKHSRLHTYGANLGATFPTLQESPNTLPSQIGRAQEASRRPSSGAASSSDIKDPSDRLTRLVLDFLPLQIFTAEPRTGTLTWVNSKFIAHRNQDPPQIFEDPWQSIFEADRDEFLKGWNHALQYEAQYSCQLRLERYDDSGDCRWFHFRAIAMLNSSGVAVHWLGTLTDIHKQHQAEVQAAHEQQMVVSEAKYRALANLSPLIVFAAEEAKGIIFANDQWEAFSGQKLSDAMHFGFLSRVHPDDIDQYKLPSSRLRSRTVPPSPAVSGESGHGPSESSLSSERTIQGGIQLADIDDLTEASEVMPALVDLAKRGIVKIQHDHKGKTSYSAEIRLQSDNGEYRWHLVRLVQVDPISFGNGEASWYGTCTDINDHKMLEQKLNQTMESKSNFFSTMSHELRTPLNGIIGNIPFLLEGGLNQEQTSLLETMQGNAVNLLDLINNIMDLSKVEAGRMTISMHWFHVRSVMEDVNDTVAPKAIEKRLELNYLVDEDVPAMVKGDPFRIRQVLINLVSNAVKFTSEGGVFIHCSIHQDKRQPDNEILLDFEVIDTGMGFSDDEAKLLFKQFSQIDGSNTKQHGGSGLGLMISRQLVELHGGKLVASSIPLVGSTFSFFVRFLVPTGDDRPSSPLRPDALSRMSTASSISSRGPAQSPDPIKYNKEIGVESPAVNSSASSDPSIRSMSNYRSERSSLSSIVPSEGSPIKLSMPLERRPFTELEIVEEGSVKNPRPSIAKAMLTRQSTVSLYSILVVCPVDQHRAAIMQHIHHVIPDNIPNSVTDCGDIEAAQRMISGDDAVLFTHIVLNLRDTEPVVDFLRLILEAKSQLPTSLVIVTDHIQKRELVKFASNFDFARLELDKRVHIVYRPSKPSKFAVIFDPAQERDLSKDRNRGAAQEISDNFKVTAQLVKDTIGDRGYRILIVEDNKTNLDVMLRYLSKVRVAVEVAQHGLECTNLVFAQEANYYSLILCDLKMPIKDGFETVSDIRIWEASKKYSPIPIIALSANAMPEDIDRAVNSGFSTYFTKPVNFPEFGRALMDLLAHRIPHVVCKERKL